MPPETMDHRILLGAIGPDALANAPVPAGLDYRLVQGQTPEFQFLHEARLDVYEGTLFINFSNAPLRESEPAQVMRGRRSGDLGDTWEPVETVIPGFPDGRRRRETAPLLARPDGLWAFVGRYDFGSKNSLGMEIYRLPPGGTRFEPLSDDLALPSFVPFVRPQRLTNGNWIIAGHINHVSQAAVAISKGDDLTNWRVVPIGYHLQSDFPETALIVAGSTVLALIRPDRGHRYAGVAISFDHGESFGPTTPSDLLVIDSKLFSGTLSTGHHYIIFNHSDRAGLEGELPRHRLLIGLMAPGTIGPMSGVATIIDGAPPAIAAQLSDLGETSPLHAWAYPEAVEHGGVLYVVFSMNKRHCWLARLPISGLLDVAG
jgi:hypothetical protein